MIKEITALELEQLMLNKDKNLLLIDVRTLPEFASGFIKNAVHMPLDVATADKVEALINKNDLLNAKVVVYCQGGVRSANFAYSISAHDLDLLHDLGATIYNLKGGIVTCSANMLTK